MKDTPTPTVLDDVFERAGLVPHETKYSRWVVTVAATPAGGERDKTREPDVEMCAGCGSHNTRCLHSASEGGREPWKAFELACDDCGVFSSWRWEGW